MPAVCNKTPVLHGSLNFKSFLQKGNGMYLKWQTQNSILTTVATVSSRTDDGATTSSTIYDYGACTVKQSFLGYDQNLRYQNTNG